MRTFAIQRADRGERCDAGSAARLMVCVSRVCVAVNDDALNIHDEECLAGHNHPSGWGRQVIGCCRLMIGVPGGATGRTYRMGARVCIAWSTRGASDWPGCAAQVSWAASKQAMALPMRARARRLLVVARSVVVVAAGSGWVLARRWGMSGSSRSSHRWLRS